MPLNDNIDLGTCEVNPIQSRIELHTALSQPRAVLFLWVKWSIHAQHSRIFVHELVAALQAQSTPCFIIDVSEQEGDLWDALAEWLSVEGCPVGELMMGGSGSLIWVQSGQVILHVTAPLSLNTAKLIAVSSSVFGIDI